MYPGGIIVPKNSCTWPLPKKKIQARSVSLKLACHTEKKLHAYRRPEKKKFLVHERVKRNRACAKSPTTPVNPKKIKGIIFVNHLAQVQLLSQPILEHGFHVI